MPNQPDQNWIPAIGPDIECLSPVLPEATPYITSTANADSPTNDCRGYCAVLLEVLWSVPSNRCGREASRAVVGKEERPDLIPALQAR